MKSSEIRQKFLDFFENRAHAVINSASLITTDEKGVTNPTLFNTAGMQPLIPYLLGKEHQKGKRLVDVQKCLRTVDIDDIGDKTHATFFEMLGNWSLGDYFKKDAINWSYEFLTSSEGLGLDPARLYVTVFEGDSIAPKDEEAAAIWSDVFKKNNIEQGGDTQKGEAGRIFYLPAQNNWWEAGDNGPCGPDSEMFYDIGNTFSGKTLTHEQFLKADDTRDLVEIWNDVFMQYEKKDGKIIGNLPAPSVDTGAGLERLTMTLQGVDNIYDTDLLKPIVESIRKNGSYELTEKTIRAERIVADHTRASVFLTADGVEFSNKDRGYVLRKLFRRAIFLADSLGVKHFGLKAIAEAIISNYPENIYPELKTNENRIFGLLEREEARFRKSLDEGLKEFNKLEAITGKDAFTLYSSYGFPLELTEELLKEKGVNVARAEFAAEFKKHQELSRAGAEQKFKGGLADANDPQVVRYHTATHILHQALYDIYGENDGDQKGSNITPERLRFDFAHGAKMTDEEKKKVEDIINEKIGAGLPMNNIVMSKAEAEKTGARHFFGEKYGDEISIYFIGNDLQSAYSKEFCGGPHVKNTKELAGPEGKWRFKIQKEEAVAQGVRRIKAILE